MHAPDWKCLNPQAPWQGRDSQGFEIFRDRIWVLGGWFTPQTPNPRDVWSSADGVDWHCHTREAPWEFSDFSVTLTHRDRLWFMGGRKLPGKANSHQVWATDDGENWQEVCPAAGWSPRVSAAHVVFQDRMWVFGGTEDFYQDDADHLRNDVWASADGVAWECVQPQAAWTPRAHHQVVVFQDKLWLLGGGGRFPNPFTQNDIWCSANGRDWHRVTDHAPWGARLWFNALVYRDRLWVLGGWCPETDNYGDVWSSPDGIHWEPVASDRCWSPRHAAAAWVHRDAIILAAGHARPVNSEVWSLQLP